MARWRQRLEDCIEPRHHDRAVQNVSIEKAAEITQQEIGRRLTQLREAAEMKQAELARKITWSQAVLFPR